MTCCTGSRRLVVLTRRLSRRYILELELLVEAVELLLEAVELLVEPVESPLEAVESHGICPLSGRNPSSHP